MDVNTVQKSASVILPIREGQVLAVYQPQKLENLLGTIDLINAISERIGEDNSGDWSGSGTQGDDGTAGGQSTQQSPRDIAIAAMPTPEKIKKKLESHVRKEFRKIHRDIRFTTRLRRPGMAYKLNELYAKLRQLNQLLVEILEASIEILQRLYIKVFIDKQPLLN